MPNSVQQDRQGPDWPLGNIVVAVPGTPVNIMSLVDATNVNAPESPTTSTANEYPPRFNSIEFTAVKAGAGPPALANNTGLIYIVRKGVGGGAGNKTDLGSIVAVIAPGQTYKLVASPQNRDVFNPYRYSIDADTAADACQVTGFVQ